MYSHLVALLIAKVQQQEKRIEALAAWRYGTRPTSGNFVGRYISVGDTVMIYGDAGWQTLFVSPTYHKDSVGTGGPGSPDSSVFATTARMADSLDNFSRLAHTHVSGGAGMAIVGQVWRSGTKTDNGTAHKD